MVYPFSINWDCFCTSKESTVLLGDVNFFIYHFKLKESSWVQAPAVVRPAVLAISQELAGLQKVANETAKFSGHRR